MRKGIFFAFFSLLTTVTPSVVFATPNINEQDATDPSPITTPPPRTTDTPPPVIILTSEEHGITDPIDRETFLHLHNIEATMFFGSKPAEITNILACNRLLPQLYCEASVTVRKKNFLEKKITYHLNRTRLEKEIAARAQKIDINPIDWLFEKQGNRVTAFSLGKDGRRVNVIKTVNNIFNTLSGLTIIPSNISVPLVIETIPPKIDSPEAKKLGIKEKIGEGRSNFSSSTITRIHNIKTALKHFHGLLIGPGEEFSFTETLGPVDGEHGYKQELVIKKDQTTKEFGGGICQVSSTVFRAAIFTGLKITARTNHSYAVSYYKPIGFDATVYVPRPDLRFINNTPASILLWAKIDEANKDLSFEIYGTNDKRTIEVSTPVTIERFPDGGLRTVFTQKVFTQNGESLINDVFYSRYQPAWKFPHQ